MRFFGVPLLVLALLAPTCVHWHQPRYGGHVAPIPTVVKECPNCTPATGPIACTLGMPEQCQW